MITHEEFADEFAALAHRAGIKDECAIDLSERMRRRNENDCRAFAEVEPWNLHFHFAPQVLELPWQHRRGLIMHELGHVLCRDMPEGGTERDADLAAQDCFGERIIYDKDWPGKGLQCVRDSAQNPPYSGYDKSYYKRKAPKDPTQISYRTKRDALRVFIDWNASIIDDAFSGVSAKQPYDSFDNINHKFGIKGKRRVDTLAKALWWILPSGSPYYLEDIDVDILNETSPMRHNTDQYLTLPDYAEERRLLEQEQEYWESKYEGVLPEHDDDPVPF